MEKILVIPSPMCRAIYFLYITVQEVGGGTYTWNSLEIAYKSCP